MKALFIEESKKNKNLPIGGGLWSTAMFHPEDAPAPTATEWSFDAPITRMPESAAPKLGKNSSLVTMEVDVPPNANGVLYALAGFSGGVTCYVKDGYLNYEFNLFEVQRTKIRSKDEAAGRQGEDRSRIEARRRDRWADGRHAARERRRSRSGPGAGGDVAALHVERNVRHRHRSGFAGVARLLRPGTVCVQRHHRLDEDRVSEESLAK